MTTANMAFTEGSYLVDPSQTGYPPFLEPTGSGNLPLKYITLQKPGRYVLIAKAVVVNYTDTIVSPQFNIFTNNPYKIIDFTQISLLPYYPSTGDLSSTVVYKPDQRCVTVMSWKHADSKEEIIYFGFNPFGPDNPYDPGKNNPKVMVYNYSLLALLIDDFTYQEDHDNWINGRQF